MIPAHSPDAELRRRAHRILRRLKRLYPDARIQLRFDSPFQLYVATVLSAQCTDERVNQVTPALFARFPDARAMAAAQPAELEALVRPTGFFRNKAKSIHEAARRIAQDFGGRLPDAMPALLTLPGVGRKTANVILGDAFGTPGVVVDTHVRRLVGRLALTGEIDPVKIEFALMPLIPRKDWTFFSHLLIFHGRRICTARRPRCPECPLLPDCPHGQALLTEKPAAGGRRSKAPGRRRRAKT
jgi:endonuclease-3